jgi:small GTP-binding protein
LRTLNLGILAHVDAGKTSLTERLLFEAGAIPELGSVDAGTTRTDSMDIERRRGITVRTNVASFTAGDVQVNLIDTPGHSDFIAEVERSLAVLDAAVLVVSAVEGVQPQTVVLWRVLRRLAVPAVIFINKIDRQGADPARVRAAIGRRLAAGSGVGLLPLTDVLAAGSPSAVTRPVPLTDPLVIDALTSGDDRLLRAALDEPGVTEAMALRSARTQVGRCAVVPVLAGSALTGAGVADLLTTLPRLVPWARPATRSLSGVIYKIEHGDHGTMAHCRMFGGELRVRHRATAAGARPEVITSLERSTPDGWARVSVARAGDVVRIRGIGSARREMMLRYDSLVVAAGCRDAYFGHDEWAVFAPGLKTLEDAGHLRSHILGAFEMAELATDPAERAAYLTFAVIGAGPTGVEVAGQIAELAHETLPREYKSVTTTEAKILLIEAGPQVLASFAPRLQRCTQRRLQKMGVEVWLNTTAQDMDFGSVTVTGPDGDRRIPAHLSAVTDSFGMKFTGVTGYTMWGFVHVLYLIGWGNRVAAVFNWARALTFSKNRPHRTITYEHARNELTEHHHEPE